jgi:hypothetical protein
MGLRQIIGFLHEAQDLSATWGVHTCREQCLIEMDSPMEDVIDVQMALPAYDFNITPEPTFTLGLSYHPSRSDLLLKQVNGVRIHQSGRPFWIVDLTYETADFLNTSNGFSTAPTRVEDVGGTGSTPKLIIVAPWNEPVIWNSSTRSVQATRFRSSEGDTLLHANFLPLTEGIDVPINLQVHQFTWNVQATGFNYSTDIAPYIGKINDAQIDDFYNAPAKHVLLESITCSEQYKTVGYGTPDGQASADGTYHYIALSATFVIDERTAVVSPEGHFRESNRRVSMHTQQLVDDGLGNMAYGPIPINDRGDVAQAPWPLEPDGSAYPYGDMNVADPDTDFFIIDPLYPIEADLSGFVNTHSLAIP